MADAERGEHFYVTLPSNSSYAFYGSQEPSKFRTKLAKSVSLHPEEWEVGLCELTYPRSWACLPGGDYKVYVPFIGDFRDKTAVFKLPNTRYHDAENLMTSMNAQIHERLKDMILDNDAKVSGRAVLVSLDERTNSRARFKLRNHFMVELSAELASPLGFGSNKKVFICKGAEKGCVLETDKTRIHVDGEYIKSPFLVKPDRLVSDLYVYVDVVERQRVGDALVPLLRTVSDKGVGEEVVWVDFRHVHYIPLRTGVFESIDVAVTDSLGRPVRFLFGEVIAKLHFRRKR